MNIRIAIQAFAAAATMLAAWGAAAQDYPTKPIKLISPWPPGGPADAIARPFIEKLQQSLGQSVVLESRAGANGVIGSTFVANAPPDGYTLLLSHAGPTEISPSILKSMPYDPIKSFEHITVLAAPAVVLIVHPSMPRTLAGYIDHAKKNPGKISYGSVSEGSTVHLGMELFNKLADIKALHVPYRGSSPLLVDLLSGRLQSAFLGYAAVAEHIKAGTVIPIAMATTERIAIEPNLPTVASMFPGFAIASWYGLSAPAGTPKPILDKLYAETQKVLKDPAILATLSQTGSVVGGEPPAAFVEKIKANTLMWKKAVEIAGVQKQ